MTSSSDTITVDTIADAGTPSGHNDVEAAGDAPTGDPGAGATTGDDEGHDEPNTMAEDEPVETAVPIPIMIPKPPRLSRHPTAGELVQRAVGVANHRILIHEPGVRRGDDVEAVHQMRVGLRRLRSDLRTFADVLEPGWARRVKELSRPIAAALGARRDLDVLAERLEALLERLDPTDRVGAEQVIDVVRARQEAAGSAVAQALDGPDYQELLGLLGDLDAALPERFRKGKGKGKGPGRRRGNRRRADRPADKVAAQEVSRALRRLRGHVRALPKPAPDQALHDLRIQAKRVRYAAEAAVPVLGRPARRFAADVTELQTVLGDHQDAVTAIGWLRALAAEGTSTPSLAWSAGVLAGLEHEAAAEARGNYPMAWKRVKAHGERRWIPGHRK